MPFTMLPIEDTTATVSRFVANSIIKDLMHSTSFLVNDVIWLNNGASVNTSSASGPNVPGMAPIATGEYIYVDYQDIPSDVAVDIRQSERNSRPFFLKSDLGIGAYPTMEQNRMEMTIRLRSKHHDSMVRWISRFRRNHRQNRTALNYHTINFNYLVPDEFLGYLFDVHALTQISVPDLTIDGSQSVFLSSGFVDGAVKRKTLNGSQTGLAVNNEVSRILGTFGEIPTEPERNREEGHSEIVFEYFVEYSKPVAVRIEYQPTIHNKRIDPTVLERLDPTEYKDYPVRPPLNPTLHAALFDYRSIPFLAGSPVLVDIFVDTADRYHLERFAKDTLTVLMIPVCLDISDPNFLIDLSEYTDTVFEQLSTIMQILPECLTVQGGHAVHVEAVAVDSNEEALEIVVDENLLVRVIDGYEMNPRKRHYVRVSLTKDLTVLPNAVIEALRVVLDSYYLLRYWNPNLLTDGSTGALREVGVVDNRQYTRTSWDAVVNDLPHTPFYKTFDTIQGYLVNVSTITGRRN